MDIRQATKSYEAWMRTCTAVVESELTLKHSKIRNDPFLFFRGTYYRWVQLWPKICHDLCNAPNLLGTGDLHVGSFGTWRDGEGRLCWGIDDFDDAYPLPYTSDLVRLAASVKMLTDSKDLKIKFRAGCDAILEGYQKSLREGGCPFVLAEHETNLERMGIEAFKPPRDFWKTLLRDPGIKHRHVPPDAKKAMEKTLPAKLSYKIVHRRAGMGSLGQLRFVAIATYEGGYIAREVKATVPSASVWMEGKRGHGEPFYEKAIASAVRSHDPYQQICGKWLIRRLSPDSNPIEIEDLPKQRDEYALLHAMGVETANVHLGSRKQVQKVVRDLHRRDRNWLRRAGKKMAKAIEKDWRRFKGGR